MLGVFSLMVTVSKLLPLILLDFFLENLVGFIKINPWKCGNLLRSETAEVSHSHVGFSLSCYSPHHWTIPISVCPSILWFYVFTCQVLEHKNDSKLGKEYIKAVYWHPAHLIVPHMKCWAGWITNWNQDTRRNISDLRYADDTTLMAESEEELKRLLMKVKEEDSEKADLKLNVQTTKIMASSPITSLQIKGEKMKKVTDFIFLGSKITLDVDCRHKIKICLLLGSKAMTNLESVLKSRDITLQTKVCRVKTIFLFFFFPVVMYRCESWAIKKADC